MTSGIDRASGDLNSARHARIAVVSPVYNDWNAYYRLAQEIESESQGEDFTLHLFAVDDGSDDGQALKATRPELGGRVRRLELVRLACNVGHQRAVAVGLSEVAQRDGYAAVAVMDADGEDRPEDLLRLIQAHLRDPAQIIVAERTRRTEGWLFRVLYRLYKALFKILVGVQVDFGNFCLIPISLLSRLIHDSNTWNHLAAAIIRSKAPFQPLESFRGTRYAGRSKMNLERLVIHGLSAISVFADVVFVRVLIVFMLIAGLATLGILVVLGIRIFSDLAIPGWATTSIGLLLVIVLQASFFSTIAAFTLLNRRSDPIHIPAIDSLSLIRARELLYSSDAA